MITNPAEPAWVARVEGLLPSIPAFKVLAHYEGKASIRVALAAAAYRLKNGASVHVSAPFDAATDMLTVVRYLHQVRVDALQGLERASWFNPLTMARKEDLLLWTWALPRHALFREDTDLRHGLNYVPISKASTHEIVAEYPGSKAYRTIITQQRDGLTQFCEFLASRLRPFVHIVDCTPFGYRGELPELLDHLAIYFPQVPVLLLTHSLDEETLEAVASLNFPLHWHQGLLDPTGPFKPSATPPVQRLLVVSDTLLDSTIATVGVQLSEIKKIVPRHYSLEEPLFHIRKALRFLRSSPVPFEFLESQLQARQRGGMYPILPVRDSLEKARHAKLPTGQAEQQYQKALDVLASFVDRLPDSTTGREQALEKWLHENVTTGNRVLLMVGSELEASILRQWLASSYDRELLERDLCVLGVGSARELALLPTRRFDYGLFLTPLWPSHVWVLSLVDRFDLLALPFEVNWLSTTLQKGRALMGPETNSAAKMAWWDLAPTVPWAHFSSGVAPEHIAWTDCSGTYPQKKQLELTTPDTTEWLAELMSPIRPVANPGYTHVPRPGEVTVLTESGKALRFLQEERVYLLKGQAGKEILESFHAAQMQPGDLVVLFDASESGSLLDALIDLASQSKPEYLAIRALAGRWNLFVDHAIHQSGSLEALHKKLKLSGQEWRPETIVRWSRHLVIGPQNATELVPLLARWSGLPVPDHHLTAVLNAIREIKGFHNKMGRLLKQMAVASAASHTEVTGDLSGLIPEYLLRDLVHVETVVRIAIHSTGDTPPEETIEQVLRRCAEASQNRLVILPTAFKSASDSPYQDLARVETCLQLMADHFYRVYTKTLSMEEAVTAAGQHQIQFAGDMSPVTMGRFPAEYRRTYKGKKVEIGRHFKIGNSRDPKYCFRVYFHWDTEDQQLVIHHAGRHLPTQSS